VIIKPLAYELKSLTLTLAETERFRWLHCYALLRELIPF